MTVLIPYCQDGFGGAAYWLFHYAIYPPLLHAIPGVIFGIVVATTNERE
jgi:hypothetical protein